MSAIAVIGQGFVGRAVANGMCHKYDVYAYDINNVIMKSDRGSIYWGPGSKDANGNPKTRQAQLHTMVEKLELSLVPRLDFTGVWFLALPTPMLQTGQADISIVEGVLQQLYDSYETINLTTVAVVKSTVPPGTTEKWNEKFGKRVAVVFNPEFLTEANYLDDFVNQTRIVLGGPRPHINKVKQLFERAYPHTPIIKTSSTTAEMVKYVTNIHLAVKVALANEFYQVCEALDAQGKNIDYDKVIEYAKHDPRLGQSHWAVPGPMAATGSDKPAFGYGGSCFVKDINALMYVARELNIDPKVMQGAWDKNLEVRPERDWEKLVGRAVSKKP